jgi:anti-sigma factor ChrR (cupin superfamily)
MPADEAREYEAHLAAGCAVCARELASFRAVAEDLAMLHAASPSRDLKREILDRVHHDRASGAVHGRAQVWRDWKTDRAFRGWFTLRRDEGGWEETDIAGIAVRRLFVDEAKDTVTMLVKMAPGMSYPPHRHAGAEECYVLEGDLHVGDIVMHAGDYQRVEASSLHGVQSTEGGCTLFIVSSLHDELIG